MKVCVKCNDEISEKSTTYFCKKCRKKKVNAKWIENNREKFTSYQEKYRSEHRKICQERSRISQQKNKEKYAETRRLYYRKTHGLPLDLPSTKRKAGEGTIDVQGYKIITKRGHSNQMDSKGRLREHVYIMSNFLGRPLTKNESVHHKNGIRDDNRIENLELWSKGQPAGQRVEDKISWCIEFLKEYGYDINKK